MITVFVKFSMPQDQSRQALAAKFAKLSSQCCDISGLLKTYFVIDEGGETAGGVYLWETRAAAEAFHTLSFRAKMMAQYGSPPEITYFDCPIVVDNQFRCEFHSPAA